MTPNNQIMSKFTENEEMISGLKKLILEDNKCISYTYVSLKFGVHVKQAIELLDKFVTEERNNGKTLSLNYVLFGNNDSSDNDNEIKMERFMIINESDIDSATDWFKNGFNKHIYSVGFGEDNDKIELNFDEYDYEVKNKNDLNNLQKLRYFNNSNVEFRNARRRLPIQPIVHKTEDKEQKVKTTSNHNKETETNSKKKSNSRSKNSKKTKNSNMFSKNKKETKVEKEDNESKDPFESGSEEDTKPNVEDSQNVSDEEVIEVKSEPIVKNGNKRQTKIQSDSSEDEDIISTKKNKNKQKYKRVRLISDSDSDDTKEESALDKFVSTKKDNSKTIKKVKEVKETHVDEDGYVVTKTVKKEVEDKQELKTEDKSENNEKTKPNTKKNNEKKLDKKPAKDTKSKNQSSITSFFKPKQIST